MRVRTQAALLVAGSLATSLLSATHAAAYCQTTTSKLQPPSCSFSCVTDGLPLAWPKRDITYYFNDKGFPGLSDPALRQIFQNAFGAWETVDCDGKPVGLNLKAATTTTPLTVGPDDDEPNESVIAFLSTSDWARLSLDSHAFALTSIWFEEATGRIRGADMHFNGGMAPFGVCPDAGCDGSVRLTDLPNVATHEAGHFLGLAHSQDQESTMWCDAQGNETNKRTLSPDDQKGICAAYPAGIAFTDGYFPDVPSKSNADDSSGGCSVRNGAAASGGLGWLSGLFGLACFVRRRRTR